MKRKHGMRIARKAPRDKPVMQGLWSALCALILVWHPHPLAAQEDDPVERARKNAREGLQAALEELQRTAGLDQRVTARSSILDANIPNPNLTGVWQSWEIDPKNLPDPAIYSNSRTSKFLRWLVSYPNSEATSSLDFANASEIFRNDAIQLMGPGTLGSGSQNEGNYVKGGLVPASDLHGRYAWAILDEGVKARINTPYWDNGISGLGEALMELGAGKRARVEMMNGLADLNEGLLSSWEPQAGLNSNDFVQNLDAISPGISEKLKLLTHDISYYSTGIFCDVARGGLKKDINLIINSRLNGTEFANQRVYQTQLGLNEPSDPYWQYLVDFARINPISNNGTPRLSANVPYNYTPYATGSGTPYNPYQAVIGQPQEGTVILPTIARIQFIFCITAIASPNGPQYYRLNLAYKPLVTLHNPFNVVMLFNELNINFANLPFSIQIFVNEQDFTSGLIAFDQISLSRFKLNFTNNYPGGLSLKPGEVRTFEADGLLQNSPSGYKYINMRNGFDPLGGYYLLDKLRPSTNGYFIDLKPTDKVGIKIAPRSYETWSGNRFIVMMSLENERKAGVIEMDYRTQDGKPDGIEKTIKDHTFPIQLENVNTSNIIYNQLPIALLGLRARTTSNVERNPGMPWCISHACSGVARNRFDTLHPMDHTHEFDIRATNLFNLVEMAVDGSGRSFFASGDTPESGVSYGILHEIPIAPIQGFSSLNGADPTGVSGFLPRFAQPIGNSWAHPLIPSDKLRRSNTSGNGDYLDHSFLLNLSLYDHFYFSGIADHSAPWFTKRLTAQQLATSYSQGAAPLDDPRLMLYRPNGQKAGDFAKIIGSDGYRKLAAWQMMQGAFNVNSTSVQAWKTMLASVHDDNAKFLDAETLQIRELDNHDLSGKSRISRFRLPGSKSFADDGGREAYWLGPREYSEQELESLAVKIVEQVRLRGPFLSMGDFVNRRLSTDVALAVSGALQQAIDQAGVNRALADSANVGFDITSLPNDANYAFPKAALGPSYQGAPGCLSQADLLTVLGNAATVRSDTFIIRACGECRGAADQVLGRAWCEAVFQRVPDWVDPADAAETPPDQLTSETNRTLGRRFRLIAFRWLQPDEV